MTFTRSSPSPTSETVITTTRCFSRGTNSMNISVAPSFFTLLGFPPHTPSGLGAAKMDVGGRGYEAPVPPPHFLTTPSRAAHGGVGRPEWTGLTEAPLSASHCLVHASRRH